MPAFTKQTRFNLLHLALQYCTDTGGFFTAGERICINQERGRLLDYEHETDFITDPAPVVEYDSPLADKVDFLLEKIIKKEYGNYTN